jgi:hypothetical protein
MEARWKTSIEAILKIYKCWISDCDLIYLLNFISMSAFPGTPGAFYLSIKYKSLNPHYNLFFQTKNKKNEVSLPRFPLYWSRHCSNHLRRAKQLQLRRYLPLLSPLSAQPVTKISQEHTIAKPTSTTLPPQHSLTTLKAKL